MEIKFRPHHFLCALCFQGRGYSPAFVSNFAAIMQRLNASTGNQTPITVVNQTDSICSPCPSCMGNQCQTEEKIAVLDHAHANALQMKETSTITWGEAKQKIASHLTLETFHQICDTCSWKKLGICENVLTQFLETTHLK